MKATHHIDRILWTTLALAAVLALSYSTGAAAAPGAGRHSAAGATRSMPAMQRFAVPTIATRSGDPAHETLEAGGV